VDSQATSIGAALAASYEIAQPIEGAGMSRVYLATERSLGRRVVIKVLADAARALDAERFRQEILTSAGLQHPHIVPVHAAGEVDGVPYFVMPFVEGASLRTRLRDGGAFSIGEATRVLRDVASALHYAHSRGVVHRDLKPENVMLSGGSAVVLDFGVAKALAAGARAMSSGTLTGAGYAVGTPRYMAPEQAAADPSLDHRADIYAFGVLAFELFTGTPPFDGTPSEILRRHIAEPPPDLAAVLPTLPSTLVQLVRTCLEKNPGDRPQSAAVVLDLLDGVATPLSGTRAAVAARAVAKRRPRRVVEVLTIPLTYVVAAGGALAYLFHLAEQERVREGIVAAGVIGSLVGLPIAVAGGFLVRALGTERTGAR
jgi:serine/threonine protein kinase